MLSVPQLTRLEHAIKPREKLLGAVICMHDDGDAVQGSDGADIVGAGNGTSNRGFLLFGTVLDTLAGKEGSTTLRALNDDRGLAITSRFETRNTVAKRRELARTAPARDIGDRIYTDTVEVDVTLVAGIAKPFFLA